MLAAGCGSGGDDTVLIRQRFEPVQVPHRIDGTAAIDCKLGAVYKVREATGTAFLTQSKLVRLRLRPRGVKGRLDCLGPLVVELPVAAGGIEARAGERSVTVRRVPSVRLAPGRAVRPRPRKQFVLVDWPRTSRAAYDNYRLELRFEVPKARWLRERVVYTARVGCGALSYLQPVVPLTDGLGWINAYEIPPDGKPFDFIVPHLAGGISSNVQLTKVVRCGS